MRLAIFVLAAVVFADPSLRADGLRDVKNLPPGFVNGAIQPDLVPDNVAYQLVLMSLRLPDNPDQVAIARQEAKLRMMGLSPADTLAMKDIASTFAAKYWSWRSAQAISKSTKSAATLKAEVAEIVEEARMSVNNTLSNAGVAALVQFVQDAKQRMIVRP